MKYKKWMTLILALAMTACSAGTNTTSMAEETSSQLTESTQSVTEPETSEETMTTTEEETSEETTAATETEAGSEDTEEETTSAGEGNIPAGDMTEAQIWASSYADFIYGKLVRGEGYEFNGIPQEMTLLADEEVERAFMGYTDIFFCDIDFDSVPELFVGSHGATGWMGAECYALDGTVIGSMTCSSGFELYEIDGVAYTEGASANGTASYTRLTRGMPSVTTVYSWIDEIFTSVEVYNNDILEKQYENLDETETNNIIEEHLGVDIVNYFRSSGERKMLPYVRGSLHVPDVENYTVEDIYNCFEPYLILFLNQNIDKSMF
ncbi:MAG: hypothetical protein J1E40_06730 [Oscillospiraceae bacterium]|nr:hypothetical protein [Oscillospiraceae bacterium]